MNTAGLQRRRLISPEVSRVAPGLYAWLATTLTPVLQPNASLLARAFALLALLVLVGALVLTTKKPPLARLLGVYAFAAACFGAWACLGPQLRHDRLDAVRGALGAVGFLLHALAWGAAAKMPATGGNDNLLPGPPLQPRHKPLRVGSFVLGLGVAIALLPMFVAFGVEGTSSSLLAHSLALGSGIFVVGASADVALRVGKQHRFSAWRRRLGRAVWSLGWLVVAAGLGLIWMALR